jgi:hypothetical protein
MNKALLAAALLATALMGAYAAATLDHEIEAEAICGTDTECMEHCPPDEDCDGGPQ